MYKTKKALPILMAKILINIHDKLFELPLLSIPSEGIKWEKLILTKDNVFYKIKLVYWYSHTSMKLGRREDGRTILPTSHSDLTTNFNKFFSFLFPLPNVLSYPQLHVGVLGSIFAISGKIEKRCIFDPNVKFGRREDKKKEKERGKKLLKFVARPKREVGKIVLSSFQLHTHIHIKV